MIVISPMVSCPLPTHGNPLPPKSCHPLPLGCTKEPLSSVAMGCLPLKEVTVTFNPSNYQLSPSAALVGHPSSPYRWTPGPKAPSTGHSDGSATQPLRRRAGARLISTCGRSLSLGSERSRNWGTSTGSGIPRDEAAPCLSSIVLSSPLSSRYPIQYSSAPHRRLATLRILTYYQLSEP
jgi:hypothetical protein